MIRRHTVGLIATAGIAVFLFFGLAWISLPGPDADEVLFITVWYRHSPTAFYVDYFRVFHSDLVSMVGSYVGALKGWVWSPFFALGRSVYSLRVPAVLLAGATLALFFLWMRQFYSAATATVALLLAATDPTYINSSRIDYGPVVLQRLLLMTGIATGTRWLFGPGRSERRWIWLAASGFSFGLALWDKATFGWCLIALAATLLVLFPREVQRRLRPRPAALFLLFLCLGAFPLIRFNLRYPKAGTRSVTALEVFDADIYDVKWKSFLTTLTGSYLYGYTGGTLHDGGAVRTVDDAGQQFLDALACFHPYYGTLMSWSLTATLLVAAVAAWRHRRAVLFPLALSLAHFAAVFLTRGAGGAHHFTLVYPFPHLAIAAAGLWTWESVSRLPVLPAAVLRRVLVIALVTVVAVQIAYNARQLSAFRQVRGDGIWSDAIYDIAAHLKATRPDLVVDLDWGFGYPLMFLTDDAVPQNEYYAHVAFGNPADEDPLMKRLEPLLDRPNALFLVHVGRFIRFPAVMPVFERGLKRAGKRARVVRTFYQASGEALAQLVRLE
jgi:hypothetical protein